MGWLSVRQLVFFHTVLQAHKTMSTGLPKPLFAEFSADNPYTTRSVSRGNIRLRDDYRSTSTFKYRAMAMYNSVPVQVRTGTHTTVKQKLKKWVAENVPLDWG